MVQGRREQSGTHRPASEELTRVPQGTHAFQHWGEEGTMTEFVLASDLDAVVAEIEISAPPARVFAAITDSQRLLEWWGANGECKAAVWRMDARQGGAWHYESHGPAASAALEGIARFQADGEIVEFDPPRRLAYTWLANWHDRPEETSLVRWELTPTASGTHVRITHRGLAHQPTARKGYSGGWQRVLVLLKQHCAPLPRTGTDVSRDQKAAS